MKKLSKRWKSTKSLLAGLLAAAMVIQPLAVSAEGESAAEKKDFTAGEIAANDYILYVANCGTPDSSVVPSETRLGLYQSNVDQEYGVDAQSGYTWGYAPDDANSVRVADGDDAESLTGSYIYMSDTNVEYVSGKSGFAYAFELPEGDYVVTVGIKNPWGQWGTKYEDILLEGTTVETALSAGSSAFEGEYSVSVSDGELNVFVQANPAKRSGTGDDPVLSYIIVKATPSEDPDVLLEALQKKIDTYDAAMGDTEYTEKTLDAYNEAKEAALALITGKSQDVEEINAASEALTKAYEALAEIPNYTSIPGTSATRMYATNGEKIQAHGGQVQKIGDTYYWLGEDRSNGYQPMPGVHLYTSTDLYNWEDKGVVLRTMESYDQFETDDYFKSLYGGLTEEEKEEIYVDLWAEGCVMERPKMLYNEKNDQYVIWFHADGTSPYDTGSDSNYAKAKAGIAVADNPEGPYTLIGSYLLAGDYEDHGFDSVGGHVRDMNVFQDDDGTAYVMYSSEGNAVMYIAKLNDDYTGLVKPADEMVLGEDFCISSTDSREAPAMFKYQDKYYLITSGCTGWAANQAQYSVADNPLGPWTRIGDPCVGDTEKTTFSTQSTCVIPVDAEKGEFIYMGDRWYNPDNGADLSDSRYVWLPIEFGSGDTIMIKNYSDWTLDELQGKGKIEISTELPQTATSISNLKEQLPQTLDVTIGSNDYEGTAVEWTLDSADEALGDYALGDISVTGKLTDLNREITLNVFCCPKQLVYFADCYTNGTNTSEVFEEFAQAADDLINTVSDQKYGDDIGYTWGYTSTPGASGDSSSEDMGSKGSGDFFDTGWWATSSGKIEYGFELEPGNYAVSTGFQEWWSSTRGIKITVSSVDADGNQNEIGSGTANISSSSPSARNNIEVTVPEGSDHILVTITKASGSDPVLSWIGIISRDENEKTLDWTSFDAKMAEIKALDENEYRPASWEEFQKTVTEAEAFKEGATADTKQRDIRLMIAALTAAMGDLISIHDPTGDVPYYVDAVNGDDNNDGTSPDNAWKTLTKASSIRQLTEGGKILLKAGCVWDDQQLTVKNAKGTAENPIVIGSYGEGDKPVINGNGADWSADSKEELAAVHIYNSENIIIENLEITNWDSSAGEEFTQSSKLLSGLVVENKDAGELSNVTIRNNTIHDVNGRMAGGSEKAAGGLIIVVTGAGSNHTGVTESWYNGLTIEGNDVYNVCHEAIYMESVWAARKLVGGTSSDTAYQDSGNSKWIGSSDVEIENNYVHDVAGDGIVVINTANAMVQYNLIDNAADSRWDYSNNPNHAGLWAWDADNVTFRYNEVCYTSRYSKGTAVGNDSMAFDFDYGVQNCVYEYNYSHDNLGGFLMLCPGPGATVNNIARYNVSVNDGLYDGAPIIRVGTGKYGSLGVQIYNNTIYWADTGYEAALAPNSEWEGTAIEDVSIFNNIFYGPAAAGSISSNAEYYNNCVGGGAEVVYQSDAGDEAAVVADPAFVDVTDYTTGTWSDGKTTLGTVNGFMIQENSPCIDAGADQPDAPNVKPDSLKSELVDNTTEKAAYDYYSTKLSDGSIDIGANEFEPEYIPKEGLQKAEDGNWYYYVNDKIAANYTGFASNKNGDWYVEKGQVKFNKYSVIKDTKGALGEKGTWYYVVKSKVIYTDTVAKNENGWWVIRNGKVDFTYTGFASNKNGDWYAQKGKVRFNKYSVIKDTKGALGEKGTWYYVVKSKVIYTDTVAKNENGWWVITNGKVDFGYTGIAKNANGWWFIRDGKVRFNFSGRIKDGKITYVIRKGKVIG